MLALDAQMTFARAWSDAAFGMMAAMCSAQNEALSRAFEACTPQSGKEASSGSTARKPAGGSRFAPPTWPARRESAARSWSSPPAANPFGWGWGWLPFADVLSAFTPPSWPGAAGLLGYGGGLTGGLAMWEAALAAMRLSAQWSGPLSPARGDWTAGRWSDYAAGMRPAPGQLSVFSTYRSDGGHAVTQIVFPNEVVATIAVPSRPMMPSVLDFWRIH